MILGGLILIVAVGLLGLRFVRCGMPTRSEWYEGIFASGTIGCLLVFAPLYGRTFMEHANYLQLWLCVPCLVVIVGAVAVAARSLPNIARLAIGATLWFIAIWQVIKFAREGIPQ